jgi:peptide/nickel transport system permease protein
VRLVQSLLLMVGVLAIVFMLVRLTGDPASLMLPKEASPEQRTAFRQSLGLDQPVIAQFGLYFAQVLRGDLGRSLRRDEANASLIAERVPATLELALGAFAFSVLLAVPLGLLAGAKPGSVGDAVARTLAFSAQIVPSFWLAMLLILWFAVGLGWLPSFGRDSLASLILPSVALGFAGMGQLLRLTRTATLETRGADFVRTARAKGLSEPRVAWAHVLRNAGVPLIGVAGVQFTYLLGGSVYIESVFAWPGLGGLLETAIRDSDFPLVQAITLFISAIAIGVQLLGDVLTALVDPRTRTA